MAKPLFIATGLYLHNYSATSDEFIELYNDEDKEFVRTWCILGREMMEI